MALARNAELVNAFLATEGGRAIVGREMRRSGCPQALDGDVIGMIAHAADLLDERDGSIEDVAAWVTIVARRRVADLLKAPAHQRRLGDVELDATDPPDRESTVDAVIAGVHLDRVRVALGRHPPAWVASASLTMLSVAVDGCVTGRACPQPAGGATALDAASWAALHYAGVDGCFAAPGEADTATVRQRRRRRAADVRVALAEAHAAVGGDDDRV